MSSTTAQRRKGAPKSSEGVKELRMVQGVTVTSTTPAVIPVATVRRNKCGTGPFDQNWLNVDCCGLFCAGITYCLHLYGVYSVCLVLLPPWMSTTDDQGTRSLTLMGHFHRLAFTMVSVLAVMSHFKAMTTDPGAVPPDAVPLEQPQDEETGEPMIDMDMIVPVTRKGKRLCRRCNAFKPQRAHHCSVCRRCIIKMDHHCPWVNNCVGIGNHKYFLLFIFYTCISCIYSIALVVTRFMSCMHRTGHMRTHHMTCLDRPTQLLCILGLVVEGILFGLFTACMMLDQASVVTSKMTHIDRLKGGEDGSGNSLAGIIEVFGASKLGLTATRFRLDWLSPFAQACFPGSLQDQIMGFCRPCMGGGNGNKSSSSGNKNGETELSGKMIRSVAEIV